MAQKVGEGMGAGQVLQRQMPSPGQKRPTRLSAAMINDEASYICDACGEEIVVPLDLSQGSSQRYVEDCTVCCRPNVIQVEIDEHGDTRIWAEPELS
jgi:hypothetical protein